MSAPELQVFWLLTRLSACCRTTSLSATISEFWRLDPVYIQVLTCSIQKPSHRRDVVWESLPRYNKNASLCKNSQGLIFQDVPVTYLRIFIRIHSNQTLNGLVTMQTLPRFMTISSDLQRSMILRNMLSCERQSSARLGMRMKGNVSYETHLRKL